MLVKGAQERKKPKFHSINEEIASFEGYMDEHKAKVALYKFMYANLRWTANMIMDVDLYPLQEIMIKTMFNTDYTIGVISRGGSKTYLSSIFAALYGLLNQGVTVGILAPSFRQCIENESQLITKDSIKQIKDIQIGDKVFTGNSFQEVKNKWFNEPANGLEIITKKSYNESGKLGHRVLTYDLTSISLNYKSIEDIGINNFIPICKKEIFLNQPVFNNLEINREILRKTNVLKELKDSEDIFYLIGSLVGDGFFRNRQRTCSFQITTIDKYIKSRIKNILNNIFENINLSERKKVNSDAVDLTFSSKQLGEAFEKIGLYPQQGAIKKTIPEKILNAKKEYISAFLRGLMDADGCVHIQKTGAAEIKFATSSKRMAKQIHLLLLRFRIISKLCTEKARGKIVICGKNTVGHESYSIRITGYENLKKYLTEISFDLSRKREKLENALGNYKTRVSNSVIPEIGNYIKKKYKIKELPQIGLIRKHLTKEQLSKVLASNVLDAEDTRKVHKLINGDYYFDKVEKINKKQNLKTTDIEVENEHCYWGNGFINHNSKIMFSKIEDILKEKNAHPFRKCVTNISKGSDQWVMEIGRSKLISLPLGNGEKLRGFRFNVIICDEMLLMPEKIYNEVIVPFLGVVSDPRKREKIEKVEDELIKQGNLKESERTVFQNNKLVSLSSAGYTFDFFYRLYSTYINFIEDPNEALKKAKEANPDKEFNDSATRAVFQISHEALPKGLHDQNLLNQSRATMTEAQFKREFGAEFTDDSSGFFNLKTIKTCALEIGEHPMVEVVGEKGAKYIIAFDPSWAGNDTSDDFAIHVIKLSEEKKTGILVHSYALRGQQLETHMNYFSYLLKNFNIVGIIGDYNGGDQFIKACNESSLFKDQNIKLGIFPSVKTETDNSDEGKRERKKELKKLKRFYSAKSYDYVFLRTPSTNWIGQANEMLAKSFERKKIIFASRHDLKNIDKYDSIDLKDVKFDFETNYKNKEEYQSKMVDFLEKQSDNIDLTINETALIIQKVSAMGIKSFDLPDSLKRDKGKYKTRKDSYSALVLGNWFVQLYYELESMSDEEEYAGFEPVMF